MLGFGILDELIRLRRCFFVNDLNEISATCPRYSYEKHIIKSTGPVLKRDLTLQEVTIKVALLMRTR